MCGVAADLIRSHLEPPPRVQPPTGSTRPLLRPLPEGDVNAGPGMATGLEPSMIALVPAAGGPPDLRALRRGLRAAAAAGDRARAKTD
jgi:hypothetical protein